MDTGPRQETEAMATSGRLLDQAPPLMALGYLAAFLVFMFRLPHPASFDSADRFADAFLRVGSAIDLVLFPLGALTLIVTLVAIMLRGEFGARRSLLRLVGIGLIGSMGLLELMVGDGLADAVRAAATDGTGDLPDAYAAWQVYHYSAFGIGLAGVTSLVLAQWLPVPPPRPATPGSLTQHHRTLLFLLGAATLFEGYDRFIVSLALPYIGADLGASESTLGFALAAIRAGAIGAVVLGRIADRSGRRRMLLFTILAYTVATAATGFSTGIVMFVGFQMVATIFLLTELSLAQVVITEEFPDTFRAKGQAILGAFAALGAGTAALLFPLFQETALGWRGLYFVGILPLLLIAFLRRELPETRRWQKAHAAGETARVPFLALLGSHVRLRFLVLLSLAGMAMAASAPAFGFASYRATNTFGWSPAEVSTMILVAGGIGLAGWWVFGVLAERLGRRFVGVSAFLGAGAAIYTFYGTGFLQVGFGAFVFFEAGAMVAINSLGTELFPTHMRSTAKAWITVAGFFGAMVGLGIVGALAEPLGGAAGAICLLALLAAAVGPLVLLLPESRGRQLEDLQQPADGPAR